MDNNQIEILKKAVKDFCRTKEWPRQFAVTLTVKPALADPYRELTEEIARDNFTEFLSLVNYQIYSKSFQCLGKALEVISVLEFSPETGRFRYHALIECPEGMDKKTFGDILRSNWFTTVWSDREVAIRLSEVYRPEEFLSYIYKEDMPRDPMDWKNLIFF